MTFPRHSLLTVLLCLSLLLWAIGCGNEDAPSLADPADNAGSTVTTTPHRVVPAGISPGDHYPDSLDEMTLRADVIVRASLESVTADTEVL